NTTIWKSGGLGGCLLLLGLHQAFQDAARLHASGIDVEHEQPAVGISLKIALLRLQDFEILSEYFTLSVADRLGELRIVRFEVARHAPEIPVRGLGFGSDEVDHDGCCL